MQKINNSNKNRRTPEATEGTETGAPDLDTTMSSATRLVKTVGAIALTVSGTGGCIDREPRATELPRPDGSHPVSKTDQEPWEIRHENALRDLLPVVVCDFPAAGGKKLEQGVSDADSHSLSDEARQKREELEQLLEEDPDMALTEKQMEILGWEPADFTVLDPTDKR